MMMFAMFLCGWEFESVGDYCNEFSHGGESCYVDVWADKGLASGGTLLGSFESSGVEWLVGGFNNQEGEVFLGHICFFCLIEIEDL